MDGEELLWVGGVSLTIEDFLNLRTTLKGAEKIALGFIADDLREEGGSLQRGASERFLGSSENGVSILIS
jgi:hypothetical protein